MTALSHLFVHVADLARTRAFYVDRIGLEVLMEHPGYLRLGGGDGFHLGMEERADEGPADMPWGARHAWLTDPDGYRLSLYS